MALFDVSTDSTGDLKKAYRDERNIWFVPLTFNMEKDGNLEERLDNFEKEEEYVAFYEKVSAGYFRVRPSSITRRISIILRRWRKQA